jgi:hypothetical protein
MQTLKEGAKNSSFKDNGELNKYEASKEGAYKGIPKDRIVMMETLKTPI